MPLLSRIASAAAKGYGLTNQLSYAIPPNGLTGSTGASKLYYELKPSPDGKALYALGQTAEPNGTSTIYKSTNYGITWSTGASLTGSGSVYGQSLLVLNSTTVVVQQRGSFYYSSNSGASFTTILNTTSGGQNNFGSLVVNGVYGACPGYDQLVYSNDTWGTASTAAYALFADMSAIPWVPGSNSFMYFPYGSSGTSGSIFTGTNTQTSRTSITTVNTAYAVCPAIDLTNSTGNYGYWWWDTNQVNHTNQVVRISTYPSTSMTSISGATSLGYGLSNFCMAITPNSTVVIGTDNGVWKGSASSALTKIDTGLAAAVCNIGNYVYYMTANGNCYIYNVA